MRFEVSIIPMNSKKQDLQTKSRLAQRGCVSLILLLSTFCGPSVSNTPQLTKAKIPPSPAIYLTDLDRSQPTTALSTAWKRGTWRIFRYTGETNPTPLNVAQIHDAFQQKPNLDNTFAGSLLVATDGNQAPEITYPLDRTGWHEIYVGIYRKPFEGAQAVEVKLSRDLAFTTLMGQVGEKDHQENWLDEIYWKTADLTGQKFHLRQIIYPKSHHAWIGFIKLVPITESGLHKLETDRENKTNRRLFVHTDPGIANEEGSRKRILSYLQPLVHTDVARLYWEVGIGDRAYYFSKIAKNDTDLGNISESDEPFYIRDYARIGAKTWQAYQAKGVDPLVVALDFAHKNDIELHASYRVGGFVFTPPYFSDTTNSFFKKHKELSCVDREGNPLPRLSYAFPETRRYVLSLLREVASSYAVDGVALLYNRRPPLLAYEAPLIEGFQKEYGQDPRKLDPLDERWLAFRATFLTQFMREVRELLNQIALEQDRPILEISAVVCRPGENLLHGMDLKAWIREGLVDTLIPYSSSVRLNSFVPAWEDPADVTHFVSMVQGSSCQLAINLMPRDLSPEQYRQLAHTLYQRGVERFFLWDGLVRVRKALRLGHRDEVTKWAKEGASPMLPSSVRLWKLGGWDLRLETPG